MSEQQIISEYLEGRIGQWALYRKLVKAGISVGTALALALGLPGVLRGETTLDELKAKSKQTRRDDFTELDRLLGMVGQALTHAAETGNLNALAVSLAKLGVNVDVADRDGASLNLQTDLSGLPVALSGSMTNLGQEGEFRMMAITLGGNLGDTSVNLSGNVQAPADASEGTNVNLGNAKLSFSGNAGDVPLTFSGNIGHVVPSENVPD